MTVAREELRPALALFAILVAHTILETARDALFLARLGPDDLAWVYLAMAGIAVVAFAVVRRVSDPRKMLIACLAGGVVGTAVLAAVLPLARALVFVLYVWTGLVATLVVPCFWTLLDRAVRVGAAKHAFAVIGAGGVLGAMVGSGLASVLGAVIPARHLVTVGAVAYAIAFVVVLRLAPRSLNPVVRRDGGVDTLHRARDYIVLLAVLGAVSTVALTLGDLTFKRAMAERLPARELATALGAIYAGLNAVGLVIQLAVTPRLFARWGVGGALTVLPLILVATGLGFGATGALALVIALKLGDGGLRHSLHRVGKELLYLPVASSIRDRWKPVADTLDLRGGEAVAAGIAFLLVAIGAGTRGFALAAAIGGAVWLAVVAVARRAYLAQFRAKLKTGEIERNAQVPALDVTAIALLQDAVASPDELEARAALDMLAQDSAVPALVLYHPCASVVRHALALLRGELRPGVQAVLGHLLEHADSSVRAAALAASQRTRLHRARLVAALHDADVNVRAVAVVGLVGDREHGDVAAAGIDALVAGTTDDRVALARALEGCRGFRDVLRRLADTHETPVLRHVVHALARDPDEVDTLIGLLADPYVRGEVRRAIVATGRGDRVIQALFAGLPLAVHQQLPRTIAAFDTPEAAAALCRQLPHEPDGTTEYRIVRGLGRLRARTPRLPIDVSIVEAYLARTIATAARYASYADQLGATTPRAALLHELLLDKRRAAVERAFHALAILHPDAGVGELYAALLDGADDQVAAAGEILDAIAPASVRVPLLAIIEPLEPALRNERLGELAVGPFASAAELVVALLADPSESLRSVAAHVRDDVWTPPPAAEARPHARP